MGGGVKDVIQEASLHCTMHISVIALAVSGVAYESSDGINGYATDDSGRLDSAICTSSYSRVIIGQALRINRCPCYMHFRNAKKSE